MNRPLERLANALAVIVFVTSIAAALRTFPGYMIDTFRWAPRKTFSEPMEAGIATVRRFAPPGSSFLFVSRTQEHWFSRLYQRRLYPDPVLLVWTREETDRADFAKRGRTMGARFAFSAGKPPINLSYKWKISLPTPHEDMGELWFGELRP